MKRGSNVARVLGYPHVTKNLYAGDINASNLAMEVVLSQVKNDKEWVMAHYSKTLAPPEKRCWVTIKELLAMVKVVKPLQP